jgi:hypothetical protein
MHISPELYIVLLTEANPSSLFSFSSLPLPATPNWRGKERERGREREGEWQGGGEGSGREWRSGRKWKGVEEDLHIHLSNNLLCISKNFMYLLLNSTLLALLTV